ncbi:SMC-Scp complex subunit ScpB [Ilumatobacter coccineus]|uniref:Segregation and condensation protein B n=1 Tax=Ilumatobacter coccineus (strain NBRC 103263 / KCTC 29153 / YM16-304) TaxID=1313172 RepID=A0A6C7E8L9_ILUCY|nr:SMC-Scp complex subunit ScpB [Ilumatobacter coccineus]BAN02811.1 segregation and condensation protein B [Ilumatobacter coccineus YM16-304]
MTLEDPDAVEANESDRAERVAEFKRAIEAIALVSHDPVPHELLAQLIEQPTALVEQWCDELAREYQADNRGFELVRVAGGVRFQTAADLAPYVERFLLHDQRARLSGAALDTLAIVAYKQPISRAQVAAIRGVDPDGVLRTLQARGYIDEVGRDDGPGQAILFGTTQSFLEKLGLESLDDLPPIAKFIPGPDVVEALEHGLRVTPEIDVTAPGTIAAVAADVPDNEPDDAPADAVDDESSFGEPAAAPVDEEPASDDRDG